MEPLMSSRSTLLFVLLALIGCAPTLDDPTTRVAEKRILAVSATPAEPLPNQSTELRGLFVDATGTLTTAPLDWTYCIARKPLAELGPVSRLCFDRTATDVQVPIGAGVAVSGRIPREACRLFGPNPPPSKPGEPDARPVDSDITGGYYQPAIAFRSDGADVDPTLAQVRILCDVANGSPEVIAEWGRRYRANVNPAIESLTLSDSGTIVPPSGAGPSPIVAAGSTSVLEVAWPSCPETGVCGDGICNDDETYDGCAVDCTDPVGCDGAETYVMVDSISGELVRRREAMSVSWYSTGGEITDARTGRIGDDRDTTTRNELRFPDQAGEVFVWAVLRDERGGTSFRGYRFEVAM